MAKKNLEYECETAGYSMRDRLAVDCDVWQSGDIKDGVAFMHDKRGGWILAFSDLEAIYLLAKKAREAP